MKKAYLALTALAAVSLASCSSDEPAIANGDGPVTITVQLPADMASRASYDTGLKATNLQYAIYECDANGANLDVVPASATSNTFTASFNGTSLSTTITPALVKGKSYQLVFWADASGNGVYTFTPGTSGATMTMDYAVAATKPNSEDLDAFYGKSDVITVGATATDQTVTLKRPFAQLNVGTSGIEAPAVKKAFPNGISTQLKASKGLGNTLDLFAGTVTNSTNDDITVTYDAALTSTTSPNVFPVSNYEYMAMDYLLPLSATTANAQAATDINIIAFNGTTSIYDNKVPAAPIRANYRTNIYGELLTATPTITVTIDPAFNGSYNNGMPNFTAPNTASFIDKQGNLQTLNIDATNADALGDILNQCGQNPTIVLGALTDANGKAVDYNLPSNTGAHGLIKIAGTPGSKPVLNAVKNQIPNFNQGNGISLTGSCIQFDNVEIDLPLGSNTYGGFYSGTGYDGVTNTLTFNDCIIRGGQYGVNGGSIYRFNNCTFYNNSTSFNSYATGDVIFKDCKFNTDNIEKCSVQFYPAPGVTKGNFKVENCIFNQVATGTGAAAAIQVNSWEYQKPNLQYNVEVTGCSITGDFAKKSFTNQYNGQTLVYANGLVQLRASRNQWATQSAEPWNYFGRCANITVDGTTVFSWPGTDAAPTIDNPTN